MRIFSNIKRSDATAHKVYVASLRSGLDVIYIDAPMPADGTDPWYDAVVTCGKMNHYASLANNSGQYDLSDFWREWERL